jgi:putative tricarboxylic transport membrane protein
VLMIAACAAIVLQAARSARTGPFVTREKLRPVLKVLWPAVALVVLTQWIGLYVAAALYTGFYMRWIGRHTWLAVLAVSILFPLATFFVFEKWFLVPMPKGPIEAWLGQ